MDLARSVAQVALGFLVGAGRVWYLLAVVLAVVAP